MYITHIHILILLCVIYRVRQSKHQLDPTEIFRTLSVHKKEAFVKIGFYCTVSLSYLLSNGDYAEKKTNHTHDSASFSTCTV